MSVEVRCNRSECANRVPIDLLGKCRWITLEAPGWGTRDVFHFCSWECCASFAEVHAADERPRDWVRVPEAPREAEGATP